MLGLYKKFKNECRFNEKNWNACDTRDVKWLIDHECRVNDYGVVEMYQNDNEAYILTVKDDDGRQYELDADTVVFEYFNFDIKLSRICIQLSEIGLLEVDMLIYFWYIFMEDKGIPFVVLDKRIDKYMDYFKSLVDEYNER